MNPNDAGIGSIVIGLLLVLAGAAAITLASPVGAEGALAAALEQRGEGPFAATCRTRGEALELDPKLTHGARLAAILNPASA